MTISGFGNLVYASTHRSRLLRVDPVSGETTELAKTPAVSSLSAPAPGSLAEIDGVNLGNTITVIAGNEAAPLLSATDTAVAFQIPWDIPTGGDPVAIRVIENTSLFEAGIYTQQLGLQGPFPGPLQQIDGSFLVAVHGGFGSLISAASPAIPGEVATIYATGLGPVTGGMVTGVPAPVNGTLEFLQDQMTRQVVFQVTPPGITPVSAPILFAGFAPAYTGIYQVNLQIPAPPSNAASATPELSCTVYSGQTLEGGLGAPIPIR